MLKKIKEITKEHRIIINVSSFLLMNSVTCYQKEERYMSIREEIERMEAETLSPYATLSIHSKGRDVPEERMKSLVMNVILIVFFRKGVVLA